jgi:hypothetical protein
MIKSIRTENVLFKYDGRRQFKTPMLSHQQYITLDSLWSNCEQKCVPPLLFGISSYAIQKHIIRGPLEWPYPCHSQGVERAVKLVSESANAVYGAQQRDAWIRVTLNSRKKMSSFKSKKYFNV